jgi:hypothetical protein
MRRHWFRRAPFFVLLVIAGIFVFGQLVMILWNGLMPQIFHLPVVDFWQALGLLALCRVLFGGFRGGPRPYWRNRARQKWMDMTPEEREKFKEEWGRRCGGPYRREERTAEARSGAEK